MKAKQSVSSVKWTQKNRIYLETLGILDARSGKTRKNGPSLNKFINDCMTQILETGKNPTSLQATPEELGSAWIQHQVAVRNKAIAKITEEIMMIANLKTIKSKTMPRIEIEVEEIDCRQEAEYPSK